MSEIQNRHLYNTGEIIVEEGQPGSHICIIEKGLVEIWKNGPDGKKLFSAFWRLVKYLEKWQL